MQAILPFRAVIKDFISNLWHLRLFFLLIFISILLSTGVLVIFEGKLINPTGELFEQIISSFVIILKDIFSYSVEDYSSTTYISKSVRFFNSLIGYFLLGLLLWVIQESLSNHRLKKSKWLFLPSQEDY